jgi:superfamily II DNA/RNA helicase
VSVRFEDLDLRPEVKKSLASAGYVTCTPIQEMALPDALAGHDVIGVAKTGTGKTVAFLLPIFQALEPGADVQALVICPTRELALQVGGEAEKLGKPIGVRTACLYGGTSLGPQKQQLLAGVDIVVGTPGRVQDFISSAYLPTRRIKWLVLDEADRMLDMGFIDDVDRIIRRMPMSRQTMLFSATLPAPVLTLAHRYMLYPKEFRVDTETRVPDAIAQVFYACPRGRREDLLRAILAAEKPHKTLIFTARKIATSEIARRLRSDGYEVYPISSNLRQSDRERVLEGFREGSIRMLVATDVAARGIDIDDISHVINFELPMEPQDYVHRIGRTGRVERSGRAISLVEPGDMGNVHDIEKLLSRKFEIATWPGFEGAGTGGGDARHGGRRSGSGSGGRTHAGGGGGGRGHSGAKHGAGAREGSKEGAKDDARKRQRGRGGRGRVRRGAGGGSGGGAGS